MRCALLTLIFCAAIAGCAPAQAFRTIYTFCNIVNCPDGAAPTAGLALGADGNFYGTTPYSSYSRGSIFKITLDGAFTTLQGVGTKDPLLQGTDGYFYGTADVSCYGFGGIFKMTPEGTLTQLACFTPDDGNVPNALIQASDGNFYGTATYGGYNGPDCGTDPPLWGCGTVFKMTPDGTLTALHTFMNADDGSRPFGPLVQASDGNFYGITWGTGSGHPGTIFKITPAGELTTFFVFSSGSNANAPLIQGTDGNFYGTTAWGGTYGRGSVFKLSSGGILTTLHSFCGDSGCYKDGLHPYAGLVQTRDGNFYGTTAGGNLLACNQGSESCGTIFKITSSGTFTNLHTFDFWDGADPAGVLVQGTDGTFYGTTTGGGAYCNFDGCGTIFNLAALYRLSVSKTGSGTVTSTDGHIRCGAACTWDYAPGKEVLLEPTPDQYSVFTGWTGCDDVNGSLCTVDMTGAKDVTATFAALTLTSLTFKPTYVKGGQLSAGTLTLSVSAPPGGVTIALGSDHPGVAHPPSFVFVPEGKSSVQFAVKTFPVKTNTTVTITAISGPSQVSGTLIVGTSPLPPSLR